MNFIKERILKIILKFLEIIGAVTMFFLNGWTLNSAKYANSKNRKSNQFVGAITLAVIIGILVVLKIET